MRYTVILEREADGGYHAFVPALPGCHSQGDDENEAFENITEAMGVYVESLKAAGEPLPVEDIQIRPVEIGLEV